MTYQEQQQALTRTPKPFSLSKLNNQTTPKCCNFQTVRDPTKQSDWPLPRIYAPHLHRIQLSSTFYGLDAMNGGLRHNGLPSIEMNGV